MKEKVIREDFGFECRYYPTIMDGPVFRWTHSNGVEINASRKGVGVNGNNTFHDLDTLKDILHLAGQTYKQLKDNREPTNAGGIWFGSEFWPWGWVTGGKP